MKKLSALQAPVLAGVVKEHSAAAAKAEIQNCIYDGAGMIDLHLPTLESNDVATLKKIIEFSKLPILALNYKSYDWEDESAAEEEGSLRSCGRWRQGRTALICRAIPTTSPPSRAIAAMPTTPLPRATPKRW